MSCLIINEIKSINELSYLELGVNNNSNYNNIMTDKKFSVDLNGNARFRGTTDEYFEQLSLNIQFDIIFIDANHDYDYALRDFNNSIDHCSKWILIHDMIPPTDEFTASERCSDSYKLLYFLLNETNFEVFPMNENYGLTFIRIPAGKIFPQNIYREISYDQFCKFMQDKKTYSREEMIEILNN